MVRGFCTALLCVVSTVLGSDSVRVARWSNNATFK